MRGKVLFRHGAHGTRFGARAELAKAGLAKLREEVDGTLGRGIEQDDLRRLIFAILMARAQRGRHYLSGQDETLKNMTAQLKAMLRIKGDDDLIRALRNCDQRTFEAIQKAQIELIAEEICERGVFVDTDGYEHRLSVPTIEFVAPLSPAEPYLPAGIEGLRAAIGRAIGASDDNDKQGQFDDKRRGPKCKHYRAELVAECDWIWQKYRPKDSGKAWTWDDEESGFVKFASVVFRAVDGPMNAKQIVKLLTQEGMAKKWAK